MRPPGPGGASHNPGTIRGRPYKVRRGASGLRFGVLTSAARPGPPAPLPGATWGEAGLAVGWVGMAGAGAGAAGRGWVVSG